MSLMEHLVELRTRLIRCAIAVALGAVVGWIAYEPVLSFLRSPLDDLASSPNVSADLQVFDPLEGFLLRVKMSAYIGIGLAMPITTAYDIATRILNGE